MRSESLIDVLLALAAFLVRLNFSNEHYTIHTIPYNTSLKDYAKQHRFQPNLTKAEALFWNIVLKHNKTGYRFLRQKIISSFILDFYCSKLRLGIEIDGGYHQDQEEYDNHRTNVLSDCGVKIIRYSNGDIEYDLNGVIEDLKEQIRIRKQEIF